MTISPDKAVSRAVAGTKKVSDRYRDDTLSAQLDETLKLAKYSAVTHIAVAAVFIMLFWDMPSQRLYTLALFVAVGAPASIVIVAALYVSRFKIGKATVAYGLNLAAALGAMIGLAWSTMPIALFAPSDADHRMIVVSTAVGLIADVYALGPSIPVCVAYAVPLVLGCFVGLNLAGGHIGMVLSILLVIYAFFVAFSVKGMNRLAIQRIIDSVRVTEQNDTIAMLLRDFETDASDWLWEPDDKGCFRHASDRLAMAAGLSADKLNGSPSDAIFRDWKVRGALASRDILRDEVVEVHTAGSIAFWKLCGKPIFNEAGRFTGYRGVGSDITATRDAEARIAFLASHDELTGLSSRASFMGTTETRCREASHQSPFALLYIDLDGFKIVNDNYGHAFGDELLRQVAHRLTACCPDALIGRLGGDEFAVLLSAETDDVAAHAATRIIAAISSPYALWGSSVTIGASAGSATAPRDGSTADGLVVKADLALYRAKHDGRGRHLKFIEEYETSIAARRAFETDLSLAMALGEFEIHYQPLVDLSTGTITCFEALLRWRNPARGFVSPADFIPVAETIGVIDAIGQWVLSRACATAVTWSRDISVAVNISPRHFKNPGFVSEVMVALETSGLTPDRLEIEITEGVFFDASQAAMGNLGTLRRHGIQVVLDDFGTGFSSLNYLVTFPVDKIKIDRSFITDFMERSENRAVVHSILALAHELGIRVTAEGVETIDQANALKARGCTEIQGFLVSKACPGNGLEALLAAGPLRDFAPTSRKTPLEIVARNQRRLAAKSTP